MNDFVELAHMQALITQHGTQAAVDHYAAISKQLSDHAERIDAVRIDDCCLDRIFSAYCKALKAARKNYAAALYFEYDLDNNWKAKFFVCPQYNALAVGDDDWACRYTNAIDAAGVGGFGKIYEKLDGFCTTDASTAATLHMIARTAHALQEVVFRKSFGSLAICIGFHDQDPIHRLANGG